MQVMEREPVSVTTLNPATHRDLETICHKCLQKDPAKRYASALEFADDLGRWLSGEPIRARAVSSSERAWRWVKRNRLVAGLLGSLGIVLVSATLISVSLAYIAFSGWRSAIRERQLTSLRSNMDRLASSWGKIQDAEKTLKLMMNLFPRDRQTQEAIVSFIGYVDNEEKIAEYLAELKERWPNDGETMAIIGDFFRNRGALVQAIETYKIGHEMDTSHCGCPFALGRDLSSLKQYDEALRYVESGLQVGRESVLYENFRRLYIQLLIRTGKLDVAKAELDTFVSDFATDNDRHFIADLASEYVCTSDNDSVLQEYLQLFLKDEENQSRFYQGLSRRYWEKGRFLEAEKSARSAIDLNVDSINAQMLLCRVLVDDQRYEEALDEAEKSRKLDLENSQVSELNELIVRSYLKMNRIDEADRFTSGLMQKDPDDSDILSLRMRVLEEIRSSVYAKDKEEIQPSDRADTR
jgi:tetratricopeptide (TPR) repeat protein